MDIGELELSVRSYNCLKRAGINTVEDLKKKDVIDLMKIRGMGEKSYSEIKEKMKSFDLMKIRGMGEKIKSFDEKGDEDMDKTMYNASGCKDVVAHDAIAHVDHVKKEEEKEKKRKRREEARDRAADILIKTIKNTVKLAGFELCDRIKLSDPVTGKKYL